LRLPHNPDRRDQQANALVKFVRAQHDVQVHRVDTDTGRSAWVSDSFIVRKPPAL
jgi:hypothetical protein